MEHNFRVGDSVYNGFETKVIKDFYTNPYKFTYMVFEGEDIMCDDWHLVSSGWKRITKEAIYVKKVIQKKMDLDGQEEERSFFREPKKKEVIKNDITKRVLLDY